ncbi:MAG: hypothetical protein HGA37_04285 [Lentimicrobium sp.]|nr:hypothetical protein [Lentimicrobium sp.]
MILLVLKIARIHLYRFLRMLNQLGIFRVIFLSVLVFYALKASLKPGMLQWLSFALVSFIAQIHFNRKDHVLLSNLNLNNSVYFFLLYSLLLSPFILLFLIWPDYIALAILISGVILISLILKPLHSHSKIRMPSFRFIPADSWEWRVGLRRYFPGLLLIYALSAIFYQFDYIFAASVLLIAITVNSFQLYHEPLTMIEALKTSPVSFFRRRIFLQCSFFALLALPLVVISIILYPDGIRPVMLVFINTMIVQVFAVSLKYSGYTPGHHSPYHMAIILLMNFSFIIPAMLPIPVIMTLIFGRKAITQLKLVTG